MSVYRLSVLAFASTVLAVPNANGHGYAHQHLHARQSAPAPPAYGYGQSAPAYGGASSAAPGTSSSEAAAVGTSSLAPYGASSAAPWASNAPHSSGPPYAWPGNSSSVSVASGTGNGVPVSTWTHTNTVHSTVISTITLSNAPSSSAPVSAPASAPVSAAGGNGANGGEQCGQDVTVTSTEKVYVTVTAGQGSASSNGGAWSSSSSSQAAPVSSNAPASSAPAPSSYASTPSSSSQAAPVHSSQAPASYSAPASSQAAPVVSKYPASSQSAAVHSEAGDNKGATGVAAHPSSSAPAPASYSSGSSGSSNSGKRGLAYNSASLCDTFSGSSQISWAYNWGSSSSGLTGYKYMPTLWSTTSDFTDSWQANAQSAINAGSTHLFSFNEPDISSQANLSPEAAAQGYQQYMQPFASKAKLCAPSVSNSASTGQGLDWLSSFMTACSSCQIDCINIHWYADATDSQNFKDHVTNATSMANGKPVYITEIGATGSNDQINSFLEDVMPWMDSNDDVAGYAYYMVQDGLLVSGDAPSSYGSTYMSYTG